MFPELFIDVARELSHCIFMAVINLAALYESSAQVKDLV